MFERFTERARSVITLAQESARKHAHNYIGSEHILVGLLREEQGLAARALRKLNLTPEALEARIVEIVGRGEAVAPGQIPFTPRSKKILENALREALVLGHNYIGTEHILLSLSRETEGVAARLLEPALGELSLRDLVIEELGPPPKQVAARGVPPKQVIEVEAVYLQYLNMTHRLITPEGRYIEAPDQGKGAAFPFGTRVVIEIKRL